MAVLLTQTKTDNRRVASRDTHVVENLYARHYRIAQMLALGMKDTDIARELKITPATVQYTSRSKVIQAIVRRMIDDGSSGVLDSVNRLKELMPVALQCAEDIMLDPDTKDGVKAKVALGIMDRNGFGPVTKSFNSTAIYDGNAAINFRERAKDAGIMVQDAEVVEEPSPLSILAEKLRDVEV